MRSSPSIPCFASLDLELMCPSTPTTSAIFHLSVSGDSGIGQRTSYASPPSEYQITKIFGDRPWPQCWNHDCNCQMFSTYHGLLRHQRDKSETAIESTCSRCGAKFTGAAAIKDRLLQPDCTGLRRRGMTR